ncbi:MAG TPA: hypothetical protein VGC54_13050 [Planctomycetota bacterium]
MPLIPAFLRRPATVPDVEPIPESPRPAIKPGLPDWPAVFRDIQFQGGLAFALGGYALEQATGGALAFEFLVFFGGLFLGIAVQRHRRPRNGESRGN